MRYPSDILRGILWGVFEGFQGDFFGGVWGKDRVVKCQIFYTDQYKQGQKLVSSDALAVQSQGIRV